MAEPCSHCEHQSCDVRNPPKPLIIHAFIVVGKGSIFTHSQRTRDVDIVGTADIMEVCLHV